MTGDPVMDDPSTVLPNIRRLTPVPAVYSLCLEFSPRWDIGLALAVRPASRAVAHALVEFPHSGLLSLRTSPFSSLSGGWLGSYPSYPNTGKPIMVNKKSQVKMY